MSEPRTYLWGEFPTPHREKLDRIIDEYFGKMEAEQRFECLRVDPECPPGSIYLLDGKEVVMSTVDFAGFEADADHG